MKPLEINDIKKRFEQNKYIANDELATLIFLMLKLEKPLLLEGHPGVGKTQVAYMLSNILDTKLIRLQCYEGLDTSSAVYEWNYQKQLLSIKLQEKSEDSLGEKIKHIFSRDYLMERPLLQSIVQDKPAVLLIDEIDRSDEEFEAYLLELLSDFQLSIPELGTIKCANKPIVVLTSNRTRELSDALKRRCLYHWIDYPDFEKEKRILETYFPSIEEDILTKLVLIVQTLRKKDLNKTPGVSESIDWVRSLLALGYKDIDFNSLNETIGSLLKSHVDIERIKSQEILLPV